MPLRWERQRDTESLYGYSGTLVVAMIVKRSDGSGFSWSIDGVRVKWIAKTDGLLQTERAARAAADRSWDKWLARAGLVPAADLQVKI